MAYWVYILQSFKDSSFYVGQTKNLENRLKRHNLGHSRFTKTKAPYKIMYSEEYQTRAEAVQREKQIKSFKGGEAFKNLINKSSIKSLRGW